jgi:hypothetical protein
MKIEIGKYDRAARTVAVTFTSGEVIHRRDVNAVLTAGGKYDADATAARVDEVALGVANKIAIGAITAEQPEA